MYTNDESCFVLSYVDPVFKNHNYFNTPYECYDQGLPVPDYGDKVTMSVEVSGDNLTLIWTVTINNHTEVIDTDNQDYVLGAQNKVMYSCSFNIM